MQNQEHKDNKIFDPTGTLRVPKNIKLHTSQPAVEMIAKKSSQDNPVYLYEAPPLKPKKDCMVSLPHSKHQFQGTVYYIPDLEIGKPVDKLTKKSQDGIVLSVKNDKVIACFFEDGNFSSLIIDIPLTAEKLAKLKELAPGKISLEDGANGQLLRPIIHEALKKGMRLNSSRFFDDLGSLQHISNHTDGEGKPKQGIKTINARYFFDEDTEVVARPFDSNIFEVRVFVRIPEENKPTWTLRPEVSDNIETVMQGFMFASDLKSTVKQFKSSSSALFAEKPHLGQTKQRSHSNCFLLAAIETILNTPGGPEFIMGMMKQDEEGIVVRLYEQGPDKNFRPVFIRVPNTVLYGNTNVGPFARVTKASWHSGGLWIQALENAYVVLGKNSTKSEDFCPSFLSIYGKGGHSWEAMQALTGHTANRTKIQATFPKFENSSEIFVKWREFDEKELNTGTHKELLNKYLNKDSPLRSLFNNNEENIILLLKEINKKMLKLDFSLFHNLNDIFSRFDEEKISTQTDFEKAMEKLCADLKNEFEKLDEPARTTLIAAIDLQNPRDHEEYKFHYVTGAEEFSGKYTLDQVKVFQHITKSLEAKLLLTAGTNSADIPKGLAPLHAYTIVGSKSKDNRHYITLRNPWGFYGLKYSTSFMGKTQRSSKIFKDVFDIELGDFTKFFDGYDIGKLSMTPSLGLKMEMNPELKHQLKVPQLEKIISLLEAGLETHGLGKTGFEEKSATKNLTNAQKLFIDQEIDSYEPAFINFLRQRLKSLDDIFPFSQYSQSNQEKDCKTPGFEDKQAFDDEISKLINPEIKGEESSALIQNYLQHIATIDNAKIKSYATTLLLLIDQIKQFQESFIGLKTASQLDSARQHAGDYLGSLKKITSLIHDAGYFSRKMSELVSSPSLFGPGLQRDHHAQQTAIMQKNLYLLSPYIDFSPGKNFGEFAKEFKNISFEEAQIIGGEIQRILSLVNSSIRVVISNPGNCPTIQLKGVNNADLGNLINAELRFTTDKIVHPDEYAVTMTLGS